jgi:hypothetical protein
MKKPVWYLAFALPLTLLRTATLETNAAITYDFRL